MERNYGNRDFEQYVQQNADQYRMFPSEKVWKGVHNALHRRRRWYGLGLAFLFLITGGAVTWVMHTYPATAKQAGATPLQNAAPGKKTSTPTDIARVLPFGNDPVSSNEASSAIAQQSSIERALSISPITAPSENTSPDIIAFSQVAPFINTDKSNDSEFVTEQSVQITSHPPAAEKPAVLKSADPILKQSAAARISHIPSIEDVSNPYRGPRKKLSWQIFFTPTISYRKLSINKSIAEEEQLGLPFATLRNVNNAVTHKPDVGFQLGVNARYPLTKAIKLRAGFQFNVNRYDIQADYYSSEVAVIDLAGGPAETVTTWTNYRNATGQKQNWLKNYYLSVAVPLGAEVTLFGNKKTSFGIAGTIQPTYVVSDKAYLISTDYKNYAKVPWLIRNVNVSTGFEAFVNYGRGKTRWQVGPQVRYQLLSSFQKPYPVKENLFDFGVKIGVSVGK